MPIQVQADTGVYIADPNVMSFSAVGDLIFPNGGHFGKAARCVL